MLPWVQHLPHARPGAVVARWPLGNYGADEGPRRGAGARSSTSSSSRPRDAALLSRRRDPARAGPGPDQEPDRGQARLSRRAALICLGDGRARTRVLLIINWATHSGGAEVQLLHLARGLAARRPRVTLCCIDRSDLEPEDAGRHRDRAGRAGRRDRAAGGARRIPRSAKLARGADVVQCTMWDPSLWGRLAAILARRPAIVADHATDRSVQVAANGAPRARWIALHNRLPRSLHLRHRRLRDLAAGGPDRRRRRAGEDRPHPQRGADRADAGGPPTAGRRRAELGLPADAAPVAMQIGAFRDEKNQLGALEAFAGGPREVPDAQLVFVGDGPMRERGRTPGDGDRRRDWAAFPRLPARRGRGAGAGGPDCSAVVVRRDADDRDREHGPRGPGPRQRRRRRPARCSARQGSACRSATQEALAAVRAAAGRPGAAGGAGRGRPRAGARL